MKYYNYKLDGTIGIYASFEDGSVMANSPKEAISLARKELSYNFEKVNLALQHCDNTLGMDIEFDHTQIEVTEVFKIQDLCNHRVIKFYVIKDWVGNLMTSFGVFKTLSEATDYLLKQFPEDKDLEEYQVLMMSHDDAIAIDRARCIDRIERDYDIHEKRMLSGD